ncbi:hypothetical protein DFP93_106187 [Aneurinibacillus soli]|uniref:Uncharacterized protein n=1 Tax=Aneurinibacillus soli TaxID=1500254 RepID=A0A0U5BNL5_9BACL|nr:hypothetical protein DFP93_106187 [Aneurinibacillus soli]BAU29806.1 hypothetical protein CB4_04043 [Aneurinibacillus soli]
MGEWLSMYCGTVDSEKQDSVEMDCRNMSQYLYLERWSETYLRGTVFRCFSPGLERDRCPVPRI